MDLSNSKITEIGDYAFSRCGQLKDLILPNTLKKIGMQAFMYTDITDLVIAASVEERGPDIILKEKLKLTFLGTDIIKTESQHYSFTTVIRCRKDSELWRFLEKDRTTTALPKYKLEEL